MVSKLIPGYVRLAEQTLEGRPGLLDLWASMNPMGRIGSPHELRGVITWLTSDASSYCTGSE